MRIFLPFRRLPDIRETGVFIILFDPPPGPVGQITC